MIRLRRQSYPDLGSYTSTVRAAFGCKGCPAAGFEIIFLGAAPKLEHLVIALDSGKVESRNLQQVDVIRSRFGCSQLVLSRVRFGCLWKIGREVSFHAATNPMHCDRSAIPMTLDDPEQDEYDATGS